MFAQLPSLAPGSIEGWLLSATCVLVMLERGFAFYKNHLRESPPPAQTYMTKTDCDRLHTIRGSDLQQIKLDVEELRKDRTNRVDMWSTQVDRLRTEMSENLKRVHARIDDLPDKIISLLKNTGAL